MPSVSLRFIAIDNFRSFHAAEYTPTPTPGLRLVAGRNLVENELGGNGAGKSSLFDALTWCLYGTSVKGLRTSDLVTVGRKATQVILILAIDGREVVICRSGPPARITIDDSLAEQADIDALIGLSRSRFLNAVVFGQGTPLFIDLPVPARGDLMDEVLGLEVWMQAAERAAARGKQRDNELATARLALANTTGRLAGLPDLTQLAAQRDAWEGERQTQLNELVARFDHVDGLLEQLGTPCAIPRAPLDNARNALRQQAAVTSDFQQRIAALGAVRERLAKDRQWFAEDPGGCPLCGRAMVPEFTQENVDHLDAEIGKAVQQSTALGEELAESQTREAALEAALEEVRASIAAAEVEQARQRAQRDSYARECDQLEREITRTRAATNPYTGPYDEAVVKQRELTEQVAALEEQVRALEAGMAGLSYWQQGFRKVRLFCLENVLKELSLETRNALLALGLNGWQVAFTTATQTASGTLRLGVQAAITPPQYKQGKFEVLSGGEGQRARLAVSLGLSSLIQRWAGTRFDFEIWDEPTAHLSNEGVDDLIELLADRSVSQGKSIYLSDHRSLEHASFIERYIITKGPDGSKIEVQV